MCGEGGCAIIINWESEEAQEAFQKIRMKKEEEREFLRQGKCYCGGSLVRIFTGLYQGKLAYGLPECEECGRIYPFSGLNLPTRGKEEFLKEMESPTTL